MTWKSTFRDRVLSGMAFLHSEFMGRKESVRFRTTQGSSITYVYDTDVIGAYTNPWETGPEGSDGWGYGQLLPRSESVANSTPLRQRQFEDGNAWHVARILSEQALRAHSESNEETIGIVMFGPHLSEIEWRQKRLVDSALSHVGKDTTFLGRDAFREQTEKTLERLLSSGASDDEVLTYASRRMETSLLEHFDGRSRDNRAAENFDILKRRFGPFVSFGEISKSLPSVGELPDFLEVETLARKVLTGFWTKRLAGQKFAGHNQGRFLRQNFRNDVDVLVELALVNRRLLELSVPHRIVFVTGDRNLVKSTYQIDHSELRREIREVLLATASHGYLDSADKNRTIMLGKGLETYFFRSNSDPDSKYASRDWMSNFSYHYVRHFWAVAGEALIETNETRAFQDLFHGLFARRGNWVRDSRRSIEELVLGGPDYERDEEFDDFDPEVCVEKWNSLTASRIRDARAAEFGIDKNLRSEISETERSDRILSKPKSIVDTLVEFTNRRRDRVMLALSDLGAIEVLRSLRAGGEYQDIVFISLFKTMELIRKLCTPNYYSSDTVDRFLSDFESVKEDCFGHDREDEFDDRQLSHLKFLLLAVIFASSDKWDAAFGHARRAQNVIDRSTDPIPVKVGSPSNMSGRESQFMLSICMRKRAVKPEDFDHAMRYLEGAKSALKEDKSINPDTNVDFHVTRFLNEELATKLGKYYYLRARDPDGDPSTFAEPAGAVYALLQSSSASFEKILDEHISGHYSLPRGYPPLTVDCIALNVLQVLVVSVFRKESILGSKHNGRFDRLCTQSLIWLNERRKTPDHLETAKTTVYRKVAGSLMPDERFERFNSEDELEKWFSEPSGLIYNKNLDLPEYELWRRKALKSFAVSVLQKS